MGEIYIITTTRPSKKDPQSDKAVRNTCFGQMEITAATWTCTTCWEQKLKPEFDNWAQGQKCAKSTKVVCNTC